jgi:3-oxoacyl-(acyl-carrier-protein) synthase
MNNRVVITGMGVVSPNGADLQQFRHAIRNGISGIRHDPQLQKLLFSCQIAGKPVIDDERLQKYFKPLELRGLESTGIIYGVIAGMDAWEDAGLEPVALDEGPDWDSGSVFGTGTSGIDKFREAIYKVDDLQIRKLGSTVVSQTMNSGVSAYLSGKLGLGNQVCTNSSACATGVESILMAYERIKTGKAAMMLAGSTSDSGAYIWGGFDAMKICPYQYNDKPQEGCRPMSATARGFVPGSGAAAMVLETLDSALSRGARIYAEILGGHVNSGGQRGSGTMTAPNSDGVQRCITMALKDSGIESREVDVINAHLTATSKDVTEIQNWVTALGRSGKTFPYINSIKGMIGHCISAAGSIESVASVLQLAEGFIFPNINCDDLHPDIENLVDPERIPRACLEHNFNILAKASFGFGDVNACIIFKKYQNG